MLLLLDRLLHGGGFLLYLLEKWPDLLFVFERLVEPLQLFTVQPPQLCIALLLALDFPLLLGHSCLQVIPLGRHVLQLFLGRHL